MSDSIVGREIDGYRIQDVLGRGGMGVVYKAEDVELSRTVAIKRINPQLANDQTFLRRFRSEARALARIDSAYIVSVHALRQTEVGLLIVMEYVDGGTVKDLVLEGPMDPAEALPLIEQMLAALEHAHGAGVIHRDIKPHNIMLSESGMVKVTDFGLAKVHRPNDQQTVTQGVYGTLNYMSPEQVQGGADLDHRSDLYSLGMTIYEMLAGELPIDTEGSEFSTMRAIVEGDLVPPTRRRPEIPDALADLVMKALATDPEDRFQSAQAMREAFAAFGAKHLGKGGGRTHTSTSSSPTRWGAWAGGLAAFVLLLALGGYFFFGPSGGETARSETVPQPDAAPPISIASSPTGADVFQGDRLLGVTPIQHAATTDTLSLRLQKQGYRPVDTTLAVAALGGEEVTIPLVAAEGPSRPPEGPAVSDEGGVSDGGGSPDGGGSASSGSDAPGRDERDDRPEPAPATLTLDATPRGTVRIGDTSHPAGAPVQVPPGTHRVRFDHPQYGSRDTTLTVAAGARYALTCHFVHRVVVQSDPVWANVFINGENTGEQTTHIVDLGAGQSYRIETRIQRGTYRVTGGTYRRRVGDQRTARPFSGNAVTLTLKPSFEPEAHVIDFQITDSGR
jgi:hypothetical protein